MMLPSVASGTHNTIAGIDLNNFISFLQIYICYLSRRETEGSIYLSIYSFDVYREMSVISNFQSSQGS